MEYVIAYDVADQPLKLSWLLPIPFVVIFGSIIMYKAKRKEPGWTKRVAGLSVPLMFSGAWGLFVAVIQISGYREVQTILEGEAYHTVEGPIQDFDPMPYAGHKHEKFTINDIEFEYSDFDETYYGFNNTRSHGGPITGNGQNVRIQYVEENGRNYIFRLSVEE